MKFICKLPDSKFYSPLASKKEDHYIWQDKGSPLIRITAPIANPWRREIVVLPTIQTSKNDKIQYPSRLNLRCFLLSELAKDLPKAQIERENMYGKFTYCRNSPILFFSFPASEETTYAKNPKNMWILYSFYKDAITPLI